MFFKWLFFITGVIISEKLFLKIEHHRFVCCFSSLQSKMCGCLIFNLRVHA